MTVPEVPSRRAGEWREALTRRHMMTLKGTKMTIAKETTELLAKLGVAKDTLFGGDLIVRSPVTGEQIAALKTISPADAAKTIDAAHKAFQSWRLVPGPKRGELVRLLGEELR